ncbi:MAG: DUF2121 domain-containing protein [Methanomicrobiales archaeon]|nr:DUF2121 domain-containing protein [Methanomicrobiales archaeon]
MSLVIAFIGSQGAAMAGDLREIALGGEPGDVAALEGDLYRGTITDEEALHRRAAALGVTLRIRNDRVKVRDRGGVLTGEVGEREPGSERSRRLYAAAGRYALVDVEGGRETRRSGGGAGSFVVLGNEVAKGVARQCISEGWRNGTLEDAIKILIRTLEEAARVTPTVSSAFLIVQTRSAADPARLLEEDLAALKGQASGA